MMDVKMNTQKRKDIVIKAAHKGNAKPYLKLTTNLQTHIVTCCIHLRIHPTSRTPYLFHSFSDLVVYVVTTLIFPKNQRQCASFSINVAILFPSFKGPPPCPTN